MKLPFWEQAKPAGTILGPALEAVFNELCDRKEALLLATPYLHYESRFLERQGGELLIRATMGREAVRHTLSQGPVRLRFHWGLAFYSGPTRIVDYVQEEQRRILRVEMPDHLVLDEQRRAFRVSQVGHSTGAVSDPDGTILKVSLETISLGGAGVFCIESLPEHRFLTGRIVDLSISLDQGFVLRTQARICNRNGQSLGLAFQPPLAERDYQRLAEWLAPREREARRRWENRAELRAAAERAARPKAQPAGVLLISADATLPPQLAAALEDVESLRSVPPAMAPLKEAMSQPPRLLLVDARGEGLEGRYRLRALVEASASGIPVLVLGSPEGGQLLATELKAVCTAWNPERPSDLRRLVQGLIQSRQQGD